jgi:predicted DNA-binding transcriptional regulator YafY
MGTRLIKRSERLTEIEQMLFQSSTGLRAVEIADACGVDRRTVYRDLNLLNKSGIPVYQKDNRFFIKREYYLATVRLNANEALALFIAARTLSHHAERQNPYIVSALIKLGAAMPAPLAAHVDRVSESIRRNPVDRAFMSILETLTQGWGERRKIKLWYKTAHHRETVAREFATYFIEPTAAGGVYAVGMDDVSGCIRALKLDRIKRVKLLQSTYQIPERFEPRHYLAPGWGVMEGEVDEKVTVTLRFSAEAIPVIQERASGIPQDIRISSDGRGIVHIQVADWRDTLSWIRSWGTQVEVLEPQPLREILIEEAKQVIDIYRQRVASGEGI